MFRQSPRRNGRNKGLKIKHVLQISLLLGVSIWLLYQVHHSDDKKSPVSTNITDKLHNDSSKDMFKLGRKDLRPKVKETPVHDMKESDQEHQADEEGNEHEAEEFVQDHNGEEGEDMKHKQFGENENRDGGEAKEKEIGDKIKTEGTKQITQHDGGSKKNEAAKEEKEQGNKGNKKGNTKDSKKASIKKVKEARKKQIEEDDKRSVGVEEIKGKVNKNKKNEQNKVVVMKKEEVEVSGPSEDHQDEDEGVNDDPSSSKGPSLKPNQNQNNKTEKISSKKNQTVQHINAANEKISRGSYPPSFESTTANSVKRNSTVSGTGNEKNVENENQNADGDLEARDKEQVASDGDNAESEQNDSTESILDEEKEVRTDLETLPESGTEGSIMPHENAAAE